MTALMTSGEASASPMPSSPSSVRTRTSTTSWQLAVFCWTDSTRRIWQMTWVIFTRLWGLGVMACRGNSMCCRRLFGGALLRCLRRQDVGSTLLYSGLERLSQQLDALRHRRVRVFFAFHLERHVTGVIHSGENLRDALVIKFERVPFAATVVSFGLNENGLRRDPFKFRIRVLQEISGVHQHAEPGRLNGVHDAQQTLRRACQAPMIFQGENHAALFGFRETALDAVNTPLEAFLLSVAVQDGFDAAVRHEGVEIHRVPASGVDADARDAELISDLDAFLRVLDILTDHFRFRADEILVSGEADQINAVGKRAALQFVAVRAPVRVEGGFFLDVHL